MNDTSNAGAFGRGTTVNDQIVDAVHETHGATVHVSGRQSVAFLDAVTAETMGMGMHNAVSAQRQAQILNAAAVATTCARLLSVAGGKPAPPAPSPVPPILNNPFAPANRPSLRDIAALVGTGTGTELPPPLPPTPPTTGGTGETTPSGT